MPYPVDCNICDTHRTVQCRKCKGQAYLLGNPEIRLSSFGYEMVICAQCFGLGIGPCPVCGPPVMSDCRLRFKNDLG